MDSSIIVAIISGVATVLAVILTNTASNKKVVNQLKENQAVLDTKYTERFRQIEKETAQIPALAKDVQSLKTGFVYHEKQIESLQKIVGGK